MSADENRQWLEQHTDRSGGDDKCWPWVGPFERIARARDIAWTLEHGDLERGKIPFRMAKCTARRCVNPDHLRLYEDRDAVPWCSTCTDPLVVDGNRWRCAPCGRGGSFVEHAGKFVRLVEYERALTFEAESIVVDVGKSAADAAESEVEAA